MMYEEMRMKKTGQVVRVYDITNGMATVFDPNRYQKVNNGWEIIKVSSLVPMDYPVDSTEYVSKTKRNKAKSRLQLVAAVWRTTDGVDYAHEYLEDAVAHELCCMAAEKGDRE